MKLTYSHNKFSEQISCLMWLWPRCNLKSQTWNMNYWLLMGIVCYLPSCVCSRQQPTVPSSSPASSYSESWPVSAQPEGLGPPPGQADVFGVAWLWSGALRLLRPAAGPGMDRWGHTPHSGLGQTHLGVGPEDTQQICRISVKYLRRGLTFNCVRQSMFIFKNITREGFSSYEQI